MILRFAQNLRQILKSLVLLEQGWNHTISYVTSKKAISRNSLSCCWLLYIGSPSSQLSHSRLSQPWTIWMKILKGTIVKD